MPKIVKAELVGAAAYIAASTAVGFWSIKKSEERIQNLQKKYPDHTVETETKYIGRFILFVPTLKPKPPASAAPAAPEATMQKLI